VGRSWFAWIAVALGAYVLLVIALLVTGRREQARAFAGLVPDCVILFRRLLSDPRVPRSRKVAVVVLLGYLALPFDLVPDFVPVAGQLDDALLVAIVLRWLLRGGSREALRQHWPGPQRSLDLVLRLAGGAPPSRS
jgi:uncharacterized membrane protein YkvA (DUF1232 family)